MTTCQYCGAKETGRAHSGPQRLYACGSWLPGEQVDRTRNCYEAEIAQLKQKLGSKEETQ